MKKNYFKNLLMAGILISVSMLCVSCASIPLFGSSETKFREKYQKITFEEELDYLETEISYPEFKNHPELNKMISNTILNDLKNFKSYSKSEWKNRQALNKNGSAKLSKYEYHVQTEVTGTKKLISVLINTYSYNGGAHGNTTLKSFCYDITEKKYLNIQQVTGFSYNTLSEYCRNHLYKKLINENKKLNPTEEDSMRQMINTGAFPQAANYEIFTVDGNKIFVYFEPYSVAPYSYGIQKIQVK